MKIPTSENDTNFSPDGSIDSDDKPESTPDFSEYMWMEHEDEFEQEVLKQLAANEATSTDPKEEEPVGEAPPEPDFSEFLWMENEEEFEKEMIKQFEQDAMMEQRIEAMLQEELKKKAENNFLQDFERLGIEEKAHLANKSNLNPDAAEFVPRASGSGSFATDSGPKSFQDR